MKKVISFIITICVFFSSISFSFAEEGYIERLLNLNYSVEENKLNLSNLEYIYFNNSNYNTIYRELKTADGILRSEFMRKYRNGEYKYYQTNGIIKNYNNFIYYTNMYFYYLKLSEGNSNYSELDTATIESLDNMRTYYTRVKNLVRGK